MVVGLNNFSHLVKDITPTTIATETPVVGGVVVVRTLFLELLAPSVKFASNQGMMRWTVIIDLTTLIKGIQIKTCELILLHLSP